MGPCASDNGGKREREEGELWGIFFFFFFKRKGKQNSEQCESRGDRAVLPVPNTVIVLVVSVDVKQHLKK